MEPWESLAIIKSVYLDVSTMTGPNNVVQSYAASLSSSVFLCGMSKTHSPQLTWTSQIIKVGNKSENFKTYSTLPKGKTYYTHEILLLMVFLDNVLWEHVLLNQTLKGMFWDKQTRSVFLEAVCWKDMEYSEVFQGLFLPAYCLAAVPVKSWERNMYQSSILFFFILPPKRRRASLLDKNDRRPYAHGIMWSIKSMKDSEFDM